MLCNAAITENYKCNPKSLNKFQKFSEQLTGNTIPPTLEVALTKKKKNICRAQVAILDGYGYDNSNNIYQKLRESPF